jgi:hypothetical protein
LSCVLTVRVVVCVSNININQIVIIVVVVVIVIVVVVVDVVGCVDDGVDDGHGKAEKHLAKVKN